MIKTQHELFTKLMEGPDLLDRDFWEAFEGVYYPPKLTTYLSHHIKYFGSKVVGYCYIATKNILIRKEEEYIVNIIAIKDAFFITVHRKFPDLYIGKLEYSPNLNDCESSVILPRSNYNGWSQFIILKMEDEIEAKGLTLDYYIYNSLKVNYGDTLNCILISSLWKKFLDETPALPNHEILHQIGEILLLKPIDVIRSARLSPYSEIREIIEKLPEINKKKPTSRGVYGIENVMPVKLDETKEQLKALDEKYKIIGKWLLLCDCEPELTSHERASKVSLMSGLSFEEVVKIATIGPRYSVGAEAKKLLEEMTIGRNI